MRACLRPFVDHAHGHAKCFLRVAWEGRERRERKKERVEGVRKYDRVVDSAKGGEGEFERVRKKDEARDSSERNEVEARADKNTTIAGNGESNGQQPAVPRVFFNDHGSFPAPPSGVAVTSKNCLVRMLRVEVSISQSTYNI